MPEQDIPKDILGIAEGISNYGASVMIIATFIIIFVAMLFLLIWINKKQMKTIQDTQNELIDQNKKLLEMIDIKPHKELVKDYIEAQVVFKNASRLALNKMNADRVAIYVFHNGNSATHGFPFFKMSCIGEWIHKTFDLNSRMSDHTNMPLYAYSGIVEKLYNNGYFENITDINNEYEELIAFTGTIDKEKIYMLGIYDNSENLAGFSMVKFRKDPEKSLDEIKQHMVGLNESIRGIIIDSGIQKKLKNG